MNLFLCLLLIFYQSFSYPLLTINRKNKNFANNNIPSGNDYISAIRYKGRNYDSNALIEVEVKARCITCSSSFIGAIAIKDEEGNILDKFQKGGTFVGETKVNMAIDDELFKNNDNLLIYSTFVFTKNTNIEFQQQQLNIEVNGIEQSIIDISGNLLSFRKKAPYYIEKLVDGSMLKLYESYSFADAIQIDFKSNEVDVEKVSFQYSDSSLNEIPIFYSNAYLLIPDIFKKSDIKMKDGKYYFPLEITCSNYICSFSLLKNYYFDYNLDMLFSSYQESRIATNKIKLPSSYDINTPIPFQIVIEDVGAYSDEITINGKFKVAYKLFGACSNSKYCVGKTKGVSGDIEYEQTIEISS